MIRTTPVSALDSEIVRLQWAREGWIIDSTLFGQEWGKSRDALAKACLRNDLFRLKIGKLWFYPAVFLRMLQDDVHRVNRALSGDDAVGKFIFWHRPHGGLGGRDVGQAVRDGLLDRVLELALGWSQERGLGEDAPTLLNQSTPHSRDRRFEPTIGAKPQKTDSSGLRLTTGRSRPE